LFLKMEPVTDLPMITPSPSNNNNNNNDFEYQIQELAYQLNNLATRHKSYAIEDFAFLERTLLTSRSQGKHLSHLLFGSLVNNTFTHLSDLDIDFEYQKNNKEERCRSLREHAKKWSEIKLDSLGDSSSFILQGTVNNRTKFQVVITNKPQLNHDSDQVVMNLAKHPHSLHTIRIIKIFANLFIDRGKSFDRIPLLPSSYLYSLTLARFVEKNADKLTSLTEELLQFCNYLGNYDNFSNVFSYGFISERYKKNSLLK